MIDPMGKYKSLATPPAEALKPISGGKLVGKTDINPQWKIEAMTQAFGLAGFGWKFEIVKTDTVDISDGQKLIYMTVAVYVRDGDQWSEPVFGCGGDFIVERNKNGFVPNDEAYKMCLTDALGNALKCFGVAADIYRGFAESKYAGRRPEQTQQPQQQVRPQQQVKPQNYAVKLTNGEIGLFEPGNEANGPIPLSKIPEKGLELALNNPRYAAAKDAIQAELEKRGNEKIPF